MVAPIVRASLQAAALNVLSNTLAQLISCYRTNSPYKINFVEVLTFVTFSLIASPPNYLWQTWLEASFPGYTKNLSSAEKEKLVDEVVAGQSTGIDKRASNGTLKSRNEKELAVTMESSPVSSEKPRRSLNIRNTAIKFLLDQSIGAAVNTVLFLVGIAVLQGRGWQTGLIECREKFWPLIRAGQKLWPMVSIISMTFVPVEHRMVFGSVVGVGWGIFLSLFSKPNLKAH